MLARSFGHIAGSKRRGAQRVVPKDTKRFPFVGKDENAVGSAADILSGLNVEITIQAADAASEGAAIMLVGKRHNHQVRSGQRHRSVANTAAMLRKGSGQSLGRSRWIHDGIEKGRPVPLG